MGKQPILILCNSIWHHHALPSPIPLLTPYLWGPYLWEYRERKNWEVHQTWELTKLPLSYLPLPPKVREGAAQSWNIHHVLTGNRSTQLPWRCRRGGFGHIESRGTQTRWHIEKMSIWGKRNWWQKPCVSDHTGTRRQERRAHLSSLYVRTARLFTLLHMGKFLGQLWGGRRRSWDCWLSSPVPPFCWWAAGSFPKRLFPISQPESTAHRAAPGAAEAHPGPGYSGGDRRALNPPGGGGDDTRAPKPLDFPKPAGRNAGFLLLSSTPAMPRRHPSPAQPRQEPTSPGHRRLPTAAGGFKKPPA